MFYGKRETNTYRFDEEIEEVYITDDEDTVIRWIHNGSKGLHRAATLSGLVLAMLDAGDINGDEEIHGPFVEDVTKMVRNHLLGTYTWKSDTP